MVNLFETELKNFHSVEKALVFIYGINKSRSKKICKILGFSFCFKVAKLDSDNLFRIIKFIELKNWVLSSELKKFNSLILKNLVSIKSYRGLRLIKGFPVRGQRTHTNAKTSKKSKRHTII